MSRPIRAFQLAVVQAAVASVAASGLSSWFMLPADPDLGKTVPEIVASRGYPVETHYVTTADGYILTVFRIPYGRRVPRLLGGTRRPPVLLQHALLDSAFAFVSGSPSQSLGFVLADAGYDVWLGNNRGNIYSTNHTHLPPASAAFWDWSWDEMARYDLPATMHYILGTSGAKQLGYVGHSQGTTQGFAAFSRNQTLASKVAVFVALAPAVYQVHIEGLWGAVSRHFPIMRVLQRLGQTRLLTTDSFIHRIAPTAFRMFPWLTSVAINLVCGETEHWNVTRGPVIVGHTPAGSSIKNMVHWEQRAGADHLPMYDYGSAVANIARYGTPSPPTYNMSRLQVPTAIFHGGRDPLGHSKDVLRLASQIPTVFEVHELPTYAHVDFTWGQDAREHLNPRILQALGKHLGRR